MLELYYRSGRHPTIEQIQDNVEKAIAAEGDWEVARAFIVYREHQAAHRLNHYDENGLRDYIACAKYARHRADLGRRETFTEAARRVLAMHLQHFSSRLAIRVPAPSEDSPAGLVSLTIHQLSTRLGTDFIKLQPTINGLANFSIHYIESSFMECRRGRISA